MRHRHAIAIALTGTLLLCGATVGQEHWPQFRGAGAMGISDGKPPVEWNAKGKNILWKEKIDGLAHSSPIVWGDRVFVTTAISTDNDAPDLKTGWIGGSGKAAEDAGSWQWLLKCHDLNSGEQVWSAMATSGVPKLKRHLKASHANCTPATDGRYILAFFGSEGLFCYDMQGNKVWEKDFGLLHSGPYNADTLEWGFASSPVIHEDSVIVQCDCLNTGFVSILNINDGSEIRRIDRSDVATWATPAVVEFNGQTQIVCNGYKEMAGYDLETGERLWHLSGGGDVPVPTPLFAHSLIFVTNGHGRSPTYAISPTARGDLTPGEKGGDKQAKDSESDDDKEPSSDPDPLPSGLAWYQGRDGSYMPTPIIVDDLLYTCNDNGRLVVRRATTGEEVYRVRVGKTSATYSGSAVATNEHIYFTNEAGTTFVIRTGEKYDLVATNTLDEVVMTTAAIAGDRILIRTKDHLVCIGDAK